MTKHSRTIHAFKRMIEGEELNDIDETEDVKADIRNFLKYRTLPIFQIWELTGIYTDTSFEMKKLWKSANRPVSGNRFGVGWAVRQLALGTSRSVIKRSVTDETLKKAEEFIKMANTGADICQITVKTGLPHYYTKKLLVVYNSKYADNFKVFEPKTGLKETYCDNDVCDCFGCR